MLPLLGELTDQTVGLSDEGVKLNESYTVRKSARAILVNEKGDIAVQYLARDHFHKLPGGGVEPGETIDAALRREVKEEVGATIDRIVPLGVVIEFRAKYQLCHISYGFSCHMVGELTPAHYEEAELAARQETVWVPPPQFARWLQEDVPVTYEGKFIVKREQAFLEAYLAQRHD